MEDLKLVSSSKTGIFNIAEKMFSSESFIVKGIEVRGKKETIVKALYEEILQNRMYEVFLVARYHAMITSNLSLCFKT